MARHIKLLKTKDTKKKKTQNHFEILESHLPGFCAWVLEGMGEEKELGEAGPIDDILLMVSDRLCVKENLLCMGKPNPPLYFFTLCVLLLTQNTSLLTLPVTKCVGLLPHSHKEGSNTHWVSYNRTPF